jgi:hypothetical protein
MSTATTLPHAGGELSSFDPLDNSVIEATTSGVTGTPFDATVSRCAIGAPAGGAGFISPTWPAEPNFWQHAAFFYQQASPATTIVKFYNGATVVLQGDMDAGGITTFKTLQGGVLTTVGTLFFPNLGLALLSVFDLHLVAGASGSLTGYLAGSQIFNVTGLDHSGFSGVTQAWYHGNYWSQIIHDNLPHVGDKLVTIPEDTASAINTGWTGVVSDINEIQLDDSHSVTSSAAGQVSTYYKAGASLGTWNVVAVCIGARAQLTSGSPTNLQIALRTNGTNYFGPTTGLDFGFAAVCASWTQNPFTAAAWDPVTAAAVESGMKSIA